MTNTDNLTPRQRKAYADLLAGKHLWPQLRGFLAGGDRHPYSKRTLDALVQAGLARYVVGKPGSGVMPYYENASNSPRAEVLSTIMTELDFTDQAIEDDPKSAGDAAHYAADIVRVLTRRYLGGE